MKVLGLEIFVSTDKMIRLYIMIDKLILVKKNDKCQLQDVAIVHLVFTRKGKV